MAQRMDDEEYRARHKHKLARGRWIADLEEHEDHPGATLLMRTHELIKRWADERQAHPASVHGSVHDGHPGVLRFGFPGYSEGRLEEVSGDDWFAAFDEREPVLMHQEHLKNGPQASFFRFNNPYRENA